MEDKGIKLDSLDIPSIVRETLKTVAKELITIELQQALGVKGTGSGAMRRKVQEALQQELLRQSEAAVRERAADIRAAVAGAIAELFTPENLAKYITRDICSVLHIKSRSKAADEDIDDDPIYQEEE